MILPINDNDVSHRFDSGRALRDAADLQRSVAALELAWRRERERRTSRRLLMAGAFVAAFLAGWWAS